MPYLSTLSLIVRYDNAVLYECYNGAFYMILVVCKKNRCFDLFKKCGFPFPRFKCVCNVAISTRFSHVFLHINNQKFVNRLK